MKYEEYKKLGKQSVLRRKLGIKKDAPVEPGDFISKANAKKLTRKQLAIMGMV